VALAMLYTGGAKVPEAIAALRSAGAEQVLVIPMFPQYCGASSGAVFDQVSAALQAARHVPALCFVSDYHTQPEYIDALAASIAEHRRAHGATQHLLMSYHGVPERYVAQGDPYRAQCERTSALVAHKLGLAAGEWSVSFQSRFGRDRWLQPYTIEVLAGLPKQGVRSVSVVCPGFAADCLETLEEIAIEAKAAFLAAGGKAFHYIPCLNNSPEGMKAMAGVALRHLQGWDTTPMSKEALQQRRARAIAHGATE